MRPALPEIRSLRRVVTVAIAFVLTIAGLGLAPGTAAAGSTRTASASQPAPLSYANLKRQELAMAGGAGALPANAGRPLTGSACNPAFTQLTSANSANVGNELDAMVALNPQDMWAVGFNYTANANTDRNLITHFDGVSWRNVPAPNYGTGENDLFGVTANNPNDVWAVGQWSNNNTNFYDTVIHWNGTGWATSMIPSPGANDSFLSSVSAVSTNNVWAVGAYDSGGRYVNAVFNWNGSSWNQFFVPNAGSGSNIAQSVYARTATDVWMVGIYLANFGSAAQGTNPYLTLIEHYDGSSWTIQSSPNVASTYSELVAVKATSATDAWAVGFTNNGTVRQTLTEHLVSGTWNIVSSPDVAPTADSVFFDVLAISATNVWAAGYGKASPSGGGAAYAAHWDGAAWSPLTADNPGSNGNQFDALGGLAGNDVFGVGGSFPITAANENTLAEQFQLPPPTIGTVTPGDQSAMIPWTAPSFDCGFTTTGYQITASDGCTVLGTMAAASSPATFAGLTNGSPVSFTVQAVSTSLGAETPSVPSAMVVPAGATAPTAESACSSKQYQYVSPDPVNFVDMDQGGNLTLSITPAADSTAIISGNSDLWTANAGLNQDIGVLVQGGTFGTPGTIVAWKESGGFAGTFSPNAAAVQAVVPLLASTTYTVKLQWKSNKAFPGAGMFAGAGPVEGDFRFNGAGAQGYSPTRLSLHLVAATPNTVFPKVSTQQYTLSNSDGSTFKDIDLTNLSESVPVTSDSVAVITGNVDLWTANAGFNQDLGVVVSGGTFGAGQLVGWKESGGFAGTFSPNAAFVQVLAPLAAAGSPYTVKLQWKTNKPASGATIYAGAGPWPSGTTTFSPTRLTVWLLPTAGVFTGVSTNQYKLVDSDGAGWNPIDNTKFQLAPSPTVNTSYAISGNADLWTQNAGFNQDIGIFVSGGIYGSGTLVAWKESGGFAGTFSPNAAFVESVIHLPGPGTYTVWLAWKTNKPGAGSTIYVGAGPITGVFSPTRLSVIPLSTP